MTHRSEYECDGCGRSEGAYAVDDWHVSCWNCNRGKSDISLNVVPKSLAEKAADIEERERQLAGYREVVEAQLDRIEDDVWRVADALIENASTEGIKREYFQSIKYFNSRLDLHEVLEAADIAGARKPYQSRQRFRYFCGICWNKINRGSEPED